MFASVFWYLSVILHAAVCFISPPMLQTTDHNDLSISHRQALFLLLVKVSSLPTVPLLPNFIWSCHCSFEPNKNVMLQSQGRPNQDPTAALVMCKDIFLCLKWLYRDTSEVSLSYPLFQPPFNELFKPSINTFSCILHSPWEWWFSFICAVIIGVKERYDMKAKVQLLASPSPSAGESVRSIKGWSRSVEVSHSHFDVWACSW